AWTPAGSPRHLEDLDQAPALRPRQRAALDDAHGVTDVGAVGLVVHAQLDRPAHDLLVLRVGHHHVDADGDRLFAAGRDDQPAALLASPLLLGLGRRAGVGAP